MRKSKIEEIEVLRGFTFLAVVLQHAIAHYYPLSETKLADGVVMGILLLLSKFAVPAFIFMTGLVLFYSYEREVSYGSFLKKRFSDIVLPYLLWALLYAYEFQGWNLFQEGAISALGLLMVTGKASYHLWYIVMIVQLYLLFPLLLKLMKRITLPSAKVSGLIVVGLGVLYIGLMYAKGTIYQTALKWDIPILTEWFTIYLDRNALMFLFYFLFGAYAGLYVEQWRLWLTKWKYLIWSMFGVSLLVMLYRVVSKFEVNSKVTIRYDDLAILTPAMTIVLILSIGAMYILCMDMIRHSSARVKNGVKLIGSYSFIGYLAHAYMLVQVYGIADQWFRDSIILRALTAFVLSSIASILLAIVLRYAATKIRLLYLRKKHRGQLIQSMLAEQDRNKQQSLN